MVDRAVLQEQVQIAERHIREADARIEWQKKLIDRSVKAGFDTTRAKELLAEFERVHRHHVAMRNRLRMALGEESEG